MAYFVKTEQELKDSDLWNHYTNCPLYFPSDGSKNDMIGKMLPFSLFEKCKNKKSFTYQKVKFTEKHIKYKYEKFRLITERELYNMKDSKLNCNIPFLIRKTEPFFSDGINHKFLGSPLPDSINKQINEGIFPINFGNLSIDEHFVTIDDGLLRYRYKTIRELVCDGAIVEEDVIIYKGKNYNLKEYRKLEGRRPFDKENYIDDIVLNQKDDWFLFTSEPSINYLNYPITTGDIVKNVKSEEIFRVYIDYMLVRDYLSDKYHYYYDIIPASPKEIENKTKEIQQQVNSLNVICEGKLICTKNLFFRYPDKNLFFTKDVVYPYITTNINKKKHFVIYSETGIFEVESSFLEDKNSVFIKYEEIEDVFNFKF